jgi:hypothetical protein
LNPRRRALASSNVTSVESSDDEDGELPGEGLVAPFVVLRGLADWVGEAGDVRPETNGVSLSLIVSVYFLRIFLYSLFLFSYGEEQETYDRKSTHLQSGLPFLSF